MSNDVNKIYRFDEFSLNARELNLRRDDTLVQLPPKVFETLLRLVEAGGSTVSKQELLDSIWPDAFVEESNLSQNIYTLRGMFGRDRKYIETVPKRGYRFVAEVTVAEGSDSPITVSATPKTPRDWKLFAGLSAFVLLAVTAFIVIGGALRSSDPVEASSPAPEFTSLTDVARAHSPAISPDGRFIVYIQRNVAKQDLRLRDLSAQSDTAINFSSDGIPSSPVFSPNGKEIFFREYGRPRSPQKIFRIPYLGGETKLVAEDVWGGFAISPDGESVAFFRSDKELNRDLVIIRALRTGEERTIASIGAPERIFVPESPTWSPDSKRLAFLRRPKTGSRSSIDLVDVANGSLTTLRTDLAKIFGTSWQPDGKTILALSKEPEKGRQIFAIDVGSGRTQRITNDLNMYAGLSVSADGRTIVTESRNLTSNIWLYFPGDQKEPLSLTEGTYGHTALADLNFATENRIIYDARSDVERDLWSFEIDRGKRSRLTENHGSRNGQATATVDGEDLYFVSDRSGADNIWRQKQNGTESVQVTFSEEEAHNLPTLSADQKSLFYVARSKEANAIRRLSLEDGSVETVYSSPKVAALNFLAASPDGRYLAFEMKSNEDGDAEASENDENVSLPIHVAFFDLTTKETPKVVTIRANKAKLRFTNGGSTFDYISLGSILRQKVSDLSSPREKVFELKGDTIYNFDWSLSGSRLAIARGSLSRDLVLITLPN